MFRSKRNFSILSSPTGKTPLAPPLVQPSPSKRMRLTSSFRNSTLLNAKQEASADLPESSPVLQRQDEVATYLDERVSKIFLGQNDTISISNRFYDHANGPLSRTLTPTTTLEQTDDNRVQLETNEMLRSKDTPPPTPIDKLESMVEILSRQKADLEMDIGKLDAEIKSIFRVVTENKDNCHKLKRTSFALEDKIDISYKSFYQVRDLLNEIYNPGQEITKTCSLILEETKRRHSTKLEKLLLCLNDRIETSEKATFSKEKELEHLIELHQRTLVALENQEREEQAKLVEQQAKAKAVLEPQEQHNDEPELDPIQQSPQVSVQKPTSVVDKSDITEDDCVIIDCEYNKPDESINEVNAMAETPEIEVSHQEWVPNHSENNGTCEDEEETDIEESKEDEDEGSFTPQQAQRV